MATRSRFSLLRNAVTILGVAITTSSALLFLTFFALDVFGFHSNPYMGLLFFLILPTFFVAGLVLIPIGMWIEHRRRAEGKTSWMPSWPRIDFNEPYQRRIGVIVLACTAANVVIVSVAAYRGIEYMDSVQFCGQLCHEVMQPEFAGYQAGPHSRVACIQCHIGPGAPWFVQAKLSGLRQVYAVTFNTHSRPIPSPVTNLRPARDTCEQCHWPEKFHGDKIKSIREYADDQANTESVTTLQMHIGGVSFAKNIASGIHWHVGAMNKIEYVASDEKRQVIPWVRLDDGKGNVRVYRSDGVAGDEPPAGERRTLDCVDCHNRPSHTFARSAERAVDDAMAGGGIDRGLPFARRQAVKALTASYPNAAAAATGIATAIDTFYRENYPDSPKAAIQQAIATLQTLYQRNIFPAMNVGWGSYANNIGHTAFPGCFRCHDEGHKSTTGKVISQDCSLCHTMQS
ncbi:MAG: NapC/NirT family cytochrome c [Acidobacteriota bacterium]